MPLSCIAARDESRLPEKDSSSREEMQISETTQGSNQIARDECMC
jgi:hypothetical protein